MKRIALLLAAFALGGCSLIVDPHLESTRVGFIYGADYDTQGWFRELDRARASLESTEGIETHKESLDGDAFVVESPAEFRELVIQRSGADPGWVSAREYQAFYAAGRLAAQLVPSDEDVYLGVVGADAQPETVRMINAYARGARSVSPTAMVFVSWMGPTVDPRVEAAMAEAIIDLCDTVLVLTETTFMMNKAHELGDVMMIPVGDRSACALAPEVCLTSIYWDWAPLLSEMVRSAEAEASWAPPSAWAPMHDTVGLAYSTLEDRVVERVNPRFVTPASASGLMDTLRDLSADTFEAKYTPFLPPLMDNVNVSHMIVPATEEALDRELRAMCWYVEGVFVIPTIDGALEIPATVPPTCGAQ